MKTYTQLTNRQKSIILGTVLGDGCLYINNGNKMVNANLCLVHGEKQITYLEWKSRELYPLISQKIHVRENSRGAIRGKSLKFRMVGGVQSRAHPFLTELRSKIYSVDKHKLFGSNLYGLLDKLAIAVWYMDDGCLQLSPSGKPHHLKLETQSFDKDSVLMMASYFQDTYGIHFGLVYNHGWKLDSTDQTSIIRFVNVVKPYVLPLFEYKVRLS